MGLVNTKIVLQQNKWPYVPAVSVAFQSVIIVGITMNGMMQQRKIRESKGGLVSWFMALVWRIQFMAVETISVLQEDLDTGVRSSPTRCFLWKALMRIHPTIAALAIAWREIKVNGVLIELPTIARDNLVKWDQLEDIEPFSFPIDLGI